MTSAGARFAPFFFAMLDTMEYRMRFRCLPPGSCLGLGSVISNFAGFLGPSSTISDFAGFLGPGNVVSDFAGCRLGSRFRSCNVVSDFAGCRLGSRLDSGNVVSDFAGCHLNPCLGLGCAISDFAGLPPQPIAGAQAWQVQPLKALLRPPAYNCTHTHQSKRYMIFPRFRGGRDRNCIFLVCLAMSSLDLSFIDNPFITRQDVLFGVSEVFRC